MYMYHWFTLLYTWNQHNIVNQLYSNKNLKQQPLLLNEISLVQGIENYRKGQSFIKQTGAPAEPESTLWDFTCLAHVLPGHCAEVAQPSHYPRAPHWGKCLLPPPGIEPGRGRWGEQEAEVSSTDKRTSMRVVKRKKKKKTRILWNDRLRPSQAPLPPTSVRSVPPNLFVSTPSIVSGPGKAQKSFISLSDHFLRPSMA